MEISTKLQTESTEYRAGAPSRQAVNIEKLLGELVEGARFQGKVVERQGLFDLIEVGTATVRARSASPLPQGASVELEVVKPGSPLQVRLVSMLDSGAASQDRAAASLNREMLGVRAGLTKISSIFSNPAQAGSTDPVEGKGAGSETIVSLLGQGGSANATAAKAAFALFQPIQGSSSTVIENIVSALKVFSAPEDISSDTAPKLLQGSAAAGKAPGVAGETPEAQAARGQTSSAGSTPPEAGKASTPAGKFSTAEVVKDGALVRGINTEAVPSGGKGANEGASSGPVQSKTGTSSNLSGPSLGKPQKGEFGYSIIKEPPAGTGRGADSVKDTFPSSSGSAGSQNRAAEKAEPEGFVSLASRVTRQSVETGQPLAQKGVVAGGDTAVNHKKALSFRPGVTPNTAEPQVGNQKALNAKGILPHEASRAVMEKFADASAAGRPVPLTDSAKTEKMNFTGKAADQIGQSVDQGVPRTPTRGHVTERTALQDRGGDVLKPGEQSPVQPQGQEHAASRGEGVHRFLSALSTHADSVQHYQQQVQNFLNTPYYMVPLWFENGAGHGHWSWWKDEEGSEDEGGVEVQHLVFDLELSSLGRVNIHILQEEQGIRLYAAASRDVLPLLREGIGELRECINIHGLSFSVADIFAIDEPGAEELFTPVPRPESADSALDIVA